MYVLWTTATRTFSILHLKFQKLSEADVLYAFWLRNVLGATATCTSSTAQHSKVLRTWTDSAHFDSEVSFAPQPRAIFCFLIRPDGSASAALASLLFDPSENTVQLFYLFAHLNLLSSDSFSLWSSYFFLSLVWLVPPLLFHLSILPEVWLLNFFRPPAHQSGTNKPCLIPGTYYKNKEWSVVCGSAYRSRFQVDLLHHFFCVCGGCTAFMDWSELAFMHGPRRFQNNMAFDTK